jgi:NAD(P)-dependent dehydrogenase (short-subunit alcohol dehydrogenase family)
MNDDLFSVEGRVAIVTGGLGLLGRQFALTLAQRGARVAVLDQPGALAKAPMQECFGPLAAALLFVPADVTRRSTLEAALEQIERQAGPPSILINNAALDSPPDAPAGENGPFEDFPEGSFDRVMAVNVKGAFLCCQVFGGAMARAGRGSIINVSSVYGLVSPDQRIYEYRRKEGAAFFKPAAYATSKSALLNLTRYLATYWAPRNVRVNSVTFAGAFRNQDPEFLKGYCPKVPLGRMARADEYNGAIVFLASEASSYMTGSNLVIDGGFTAW